MKKYLIQAEVPLDGTLQKFYSYLYTLIRPLDRELKRYPQQAALHRLEFVSRQGALSIHIHSQFLVTHGCGDD